MDYIGTYIDTFVNRPIWHRQVITVDDTGARDCQYYLQKFDVGRDEESCQPLTRGLVNLHLAGYYADNDPLTISLSAIDDEGNCKWCCWDDDTDSGAAERICKTLRAFGMYPVRESVRESRGGHVWLFFPRKISAENLLAFNRSVQSSAKVCLVEFFPKSSTGHSQVRAPLGVHRKVDPPVRGYFMDAPPNILAQLKYVATLPRSNPDKIERIAATVLREEKLAYERAYRAVRARSYDRSSILPLVPFTRRIAGGYSTRCPLCADEGHDKSGDNLHISDDGLTFTCVWGGPREGPHKAPEIRKRLEQLGGR